MDSAESDPVQSALKALKKTPSSAGGAPRVIRQEMLEASVCNEYECLTLSAHLNHNIEQLQISAQPSALLTVPRFSDVAAELPDSPSACILSAPLVKNVFLQSLGSSSLYLSVLITFTIDTSTFSQTVPRLHIYISYFDWSSQIMGYCQREPQISCMLFFARIS